MNNLSQPAIPRVSIMGDPMPTEWQNFFRDLFVRVGGSRSYTLSEINEVIAPLFSLSPSMLVATGADGKVTSASDLSQWVIGVTGQVVVTGDALGRVTLSVPGVVPPGGSVGQPLIKASSEDYDLAWGDASLAEIIGEFGNIDFYLDLLTGQITEDELYTGLTNRLNMIDVDFIYDQVYNEVFGGMNGDFEGFYRQAQLVRGDLTAESDARLALNAVVIENGNSIIAHSAVLLELNNAITDPSTGLLALSNAWTLLDSRVQVTEGDIIAQASFITALQVEVNDPITGLEATADAVDVLDSRITVIDGVVTAQSSSITTLNAQVNSITGVVNAQATAISGLQVSVTNLGDDITATADSVTQLGVTVAGNTASIISNAQTTATLSGNVRAEYSLWLNANGKITGFRSMIDHTGSNEFDIVSNRFRIINQDDNGDIKVPFVVGDIDGVSTVGINGNLVIDGTILARHISVTSLSAITANVGTLAAGVIQSDDYDAIHGFKIDLNNSAITVSGPGGLLINASGGIKVVAGGDITMMGSSSGPSELIMSKSDSAKTVGFSFTEGAATWPVSDLLKIDPNGNNHVSLVVGSGDSNRFASIWLNAYQKISLNHVSGGTRMQLEWGSGALFTFTSNVCSLGTSSSLWTEVWATDGSINTSDETKKDLIEDSDLGLNFIEQLRPRKWVWDWGTRPHYGLISQEIGQLLGQRGHDFAGYIKAELVKLEDGTWIEKKDKGGKKVIEEKDSYHLRYTEFIGPIIKAIQELSSRIGKLENN